MRIFLIIQEDSLFLPKGLKVILNNHDIQGACILNQKLPSDTYLKLVSRYLNVLGVSGFLFFGLKTCLNKLNHKNSLRKQLTRNGVPLLEATDINDKGFVDAVRTIAPDLIVSIACPQKIRNDLMRVPSRGCINLHGGYLPDFPGVFTPFWNLYHNSEFAGTTVHYITDKIDSGPILDREKFQITSRDTIYSLYIKLSDVGITLLHKVLKRLELESDPVKGLIPNELKSGSYNSFPTLRDRRRFRRLGLKAF
jgi:methionyl-tRNA formyltransferase